jgi:hypothetical protein
MGQELVHGCLPLLPLTFLLGFFLLFLLLNSLLLLSFVELLQRAETPS